MASTFQILTYPSVASSGPHLVSLFFYAFYGGPLLGGCDAMTRALGEFSLIVKTAVTHKDSSMWLL